MEVYALDHVQIAMPPDQEEQARVFYGGVLGLAEQPKPANLAKRGGVWFGGGTLRLHLGVEPEFHPARCAAAGYAVATDEPLAGYDRLYVSDPFGNRIELLEPVAGG